jgi:ABC-2 type transport system permease protein
VSAAILRSAFRIGVRDLESIWPTPQVWIAAWLLRVTTWASMWILMGRLLDSDDVLMYLLIGQSIMIGPQAVGFAVAASAWDRMEGTYAQLVATPSRLAPYIVGRTSIWMANGIATSVLALSILLPLFGVLPPARAVPGIMMSLVIINCAAFGFFLFLGCFVIRAPNTRNMVHNLASVVIVAIAGVAVPTAFWPTALQLVAQILPVTHGLLAVRHLFDGGDYASAMTLLSTELMVGLVWFAIAVWLMDRVADNGRRDGTIEVSLG